MKIKLPWKHKKIYIYPNRYGFLFFALFGLMILVGASYSNNLVFLMGFILISFLFLVILLTAKNLKKIEISQLTVQPGFPGDIVRAQLSLNNEGDFEHTDIQFKVDGFESSGKLHHLSPGDHKNISLSFQLPKQRGLYKTHRIKVSTQNPFGLFYSWYWFKVSSEVLVYPRPLGLKERPQQSYETGDEFSGLKEFEKGDPLSRISWKHMAKRDELLVKEFNDSEQQEDLMNIQEAPQAEYEEKLSQLSLWLLEAEKSRKTYSVDIGNGHPTLFRGPQHLQECLSVLAKAEGS